MPSPSLSAPASATRKLKIPCVPSLIPCTTTVPLRTALIKPPGVIRAIVGLLTL